jgi:amino acid permease
LIYFLVASSIVLFGLRITKFSEFILFSCMLILIFGMISFSMPHVKIINLTYSNWSALPSIFGVTIFAYVGHTIIPSLIREEKDRSNMKPVVVAGFLLPLVIYLTWSMVICGVVPAVGDDKNPLETRTLKSAAHFGQPATVPLGHIVGGTIILLGSLFAVLATMTSYLGFGISLRDGWINFFAQFKLKLRKVLAVALSVLFPLVLALMRPNSFITALEFGGIYGGGLFAGILPCLLVLRARKMSPGKKYTTVGGNALTWIVMLLFLGGLIYKTVLIMTF